MTLAHWDEVERERAEVGPPGSSATDLGTAAGSVTIGLTRREIDPGARSTPAHVELAEEEIFFVLGGNGFSWQDASAYPIAEHDSVVYRANEAAHTLIAGDDGLDVLAFDQRALPAGGAYLPRAGVVRLGAAAVAVANEPHPWQREAAAGELATEDASVRPESIVALDAAPLSPARFRDLGRAAASARTGLEHDVLGPGRLGAPPHCHSAEEELFVVLDGDGTLLLGDDEYAVRRGRVVSRPAGTGVPHAFRGGEGGSTLLAYGTREPADVAYSPRSRIVSFRGLGVAGRLEPADLRQEEASFR